MLFVVQNKLRKLGKPQTKYTKRMYEISYNKQ